MLCKCVYLVGLLSIYTWMFMAVGVEVCLFGRVAVYLSLDAYKYCISVFIWWGCCPYMCLNVHGCWFISVFIWWGCCVFLCECLQVLFLFTLHDLGRLGQYAQQLADLPLVMDLIPLLCCLYFEKRLRPLRLSFLQAATLLGLGGQRRQRTHATTTAAAAAAAERSSSLSP